MKASFASDASTAPAKFVDFPPSIPSKTAPASAAAPSADRKDHRHPREMAYRIASRLMLGDMVISFLSILAGLQIRDWQRSGEILRTMSIEMQLVGWSAASAIAFTVLMGALRAYDLRNLYKMNLLVKNLTKSVLLWAVVVLAAVGLLRTVDFKPQISLIYAMVALFGGILTWRMAAFTWLLNPSIRGAACSRIVVIGWNEKAGHLRESIHRDMTQLGEIVGCVPTPGGRFTVKPPVEVAVLGDYSDLPTLIRENRVDAVILSDVSCPAGEIQHLISFCQREYVSFQMIPEYFPALNSSLQVQTVSGVPLLGVSQLPLDRTLNRALKRGVDIVGALAGLAISSLIIPWFCLAVYMESPGPVIYRQKRTSRGGRSFFIYKIRSMRLNAETSSGAVWCKKDDDRRLKVGSFMRKTNIDELPQFWNVLKGDMSLVGPRPERPELIEKFKHEIPNYNVRHKVRAGLTGWAAINGWRGDTDLRKRVEADLYYMENWSIFLDLYCIFGTMFKIKNAY